VPPNKALLTANSAFQLRFGSVLAFNLGGSTIIGGAVGRQRSADPLGRTMLRDSCMGAA